MLRITKLVIVPICVLTLICLLWIASSVKTNRVSEISKGLKFGQISFVSEHRWGKRSFLIDEKKDLVVVPPSVLILKVLDGKVYGVRKIIHASDDWPGNTQPSDGDIFQNEIVKFPDNVYFILDYKKNNEVTFYRDSDFREIWEVGVYFD